MYACSYKVGGTHVEAVLPSGAVRLLVEVRAGGRPASEQQRLTVRPAPLKAEQPAAQPGDVQDQV